MPFADKISDTYPAEAPPDNIIITPAENSFNNNDRYIGEMVLIDSSPMSRIIIYYTVHASRPIVTAIGPVRSQFFRVTFFVFRFRLYFLFSPTNGKYQYYYLSQWAHDENGIKEKQLQQSVNIYIRYYIIPFKNLILYWRV